ncbi:MAG: MBL fold metallo-hydrolase [Thermoplasmata archaeon]|nr:MAG: MBL fold metallo-hydrolase [Thermoplasmata archaeon]
MDISFKPIWFDSLGAKSSCILVRTPDISILIDPGIAIMHPSFPTSQSKKIYWKEQGRREIKKASKNADIIIISHYHYDHYFPNDMNIYVNKILLTKNPNEYINDSQRNRAENFFSRICEYFGNIKLEDVWVYNKIKEYANPLDNLPIAKHKDFGDYNRRRKELLKQGMEWFNNKVSKWNENPRIPELKFDEVEIKYPEGKKFNFGNTRIRITNPLFHGIEFSRVGWIFATVIEYKNKKLIHSSDMNGPIIEDYAKWIIKENPDILILDGPMTYMLGYLLNKTNLNRAINNVVEILKETKTSLIIYDHHLPREARFKENTKEVWKIAKNFNKRLLTAAEFLGKTPKVLENKALTKINNKHAFI